MKHLIVILLLFNLSCRNDRQPDLPGTYRSAEKSMIYRFFHKGLYTAGSMLILKRDSTFNYNTCGTEVTGKWERWKDSLRLYPSDILQKVENVKQTAVHRKYFISFYINGKNLEQIRQVSYKNRQVASYHLLEKISG